MSRSPVRSASPSLLRYLLVHSAVGAGLGVVGGGALLVTNALGLPPLARSSVDLGTSVIVIASGVATVTPLVVATAIGLLPAAPPAEAQGRRHGHWFDGVRRVALNLAYVRAHRRR
jgi:hypothetical protein